MEAIEQMFYNNKIKTNVLYNKLYKTIDNYINL